MFSFRKPLMPGKINYVTLGQSTQMPNGRSGFNFWCSRFIKAWYMDLLTLNHSLQYAKSLCNIIAR